MRRVAWFLVILALFVTGCASSGTTGDASMGAAQTKEKERPQGGGGY
jgi:outer membrane lipoprotein-sorting protein